MPSLTEPSASIELELTGMTCASCANRIERKLNKLPGVMATVNYATEKAKVSYPGGVTTARSGRHGRGDRVRRPGAGSERAPPTSRDRPQPATRSAPG